MDKMYVYETSQLIRLWNVNSTFYSFQAETWVHDRRNV